MRHIVVFIDGNVRKGHEIASEPTPIVFVPQFAAKVEGEERQNAICLKFKRVSKRTTKTRTVYYYERLA